MLELSKMAPLKKDNRGDKIECWIWKWSDNKLRENEGKCRLVFEWDLLRTGVRRHFFHQGTRDTCKEPPWADGSQRARRRTSSWGQKQAKGKSNRNSNREHNTRTLYLCVADADELQLNGHENAMDWLQGSNWQWGCSGGTGHDQHANEHTKQILGSPWTSVLPSIEL